MFFFFFLSTYACWSAGSSGSQAGGQTGEHIFRVGRRKGKKGTTATLVLLKLAIAIAGWIKIVTEREIDHLLARLSIRLEPSGC